MYLQSECITLSVSGGTYLTNAGYNGGVFALKTSSNDATTKTSITFTNSILFSGNNIN